MKKNIAIFVLSVWAFVSALSMRGAYALHKEQRALINAQRETINEYKKLFDQLSGALK